MLNTRTVPREQNQSTAAQHTRATSRCDGALSDPLCDRLAQTSELRSFLVQTPALRSYIEANTKAEEANRKAEVNLRQRPANDANTVGRARAHRVVDQRNDGAADDGQDDQTLPGQVLPDGDSRPVPPPPRVEEVQADRNPRNDGAADDGLDDPQRLVPRWVDREDFRARTYVRFARRGKLLTRIGDLLEQIRQADTLEDLEWCVSHALDATDAWLDKHENSPGSAARRRPQIDTVRTWLLALKRRIECLMDQRPDRNGADGGARPVRAGARHAGGSPPPSASRTPVQHPSPRSGNFLAPLAKEGERPQTLGSRLLNHAISGTTVASGVGSAVGGAGLTARRTVLPAGGDGSAAALVGAASFGALGGASALGGLSAVGRFVRGTRHTANWSKLSTDQRVDHVLDQGRDATEVARGAVNTANHLAAMEKGTLPLMATSSALGVAAGGLSMARGGFDFARARGRLQDLAHLEARLENLPEDGRDRDWMAQNEVAGTIGALRKVHKRSQKEAAFKMATGAVDVAAGALFLSGAGAPIAIGLAVFNGLLRFGHAMQNYLRKREANALGRIAGRLDPAGRLTASIKPEKVTYDEARDRLHEAYYRNYDQAMDTSTPPPGFSGGEWSDVRAFIQADKPAGAEVRRYEGRTEARRAGRTEMDARKTWGEFTEGSKTYREKPSTLRKARLLFHANAHESPQAIDASHAEIARAVVEIALQSFDAENRRFTDRRIVANAPDDGLRSAAARTLLANVGVTEDEWVKIWRASGGWFAGDDDGNGQRRPGPRLPDRQLLYANVKRRIDGL